MAEYSTMRQGLDSWVKSECVNTYNAIKGISIALNDACGLSASLIHTSRQNFNDHVLPAIKVEIDKLPIMRSLQPDIVDAIHDAINLIPDKGVMNAVLDKAIVAAIAQCQCSKQDATIPMTYRVGSMVTIHSAESELTGLKGVIEFYDENMSAPYKVLVNYPLHGHVSGWFKHSELTLI